MPLSATIEFPQADAAALLAQMNRAQKNLGMSVGRSIMQAVKHVSASLGTSTKVSDEFRPYFPVGRTRKGDKIIFNVQTYRAPHSYKGKFKQKFSRNGALRTSVAYAKDEAQLKTFPSVRIKFRGLAKRSWSAFRGAARASSKEISTYAMAAASRHMYFEANLKGDNPYAMVTNRLDYITDALQGGENAVETAIGRAARGMEDSVNRQIIKRFG